MLHSYQDRGRNPFKMVLLLFMALLSLWMLLSPYGLWQYLKVSRALSELREENQQLLGQNQQLEEEIRRLLDDPEYIEEVARREHGLLKKNEIIFDFSSNRR